MPIYHYKLELTRKDSHGTYADTAYITVQAVDPDDGRMHLRQTFRHSEPETVIKDMELITVLQSDTQH